MNLLKLLRPGKPTPRRTAQFAKSRGRPRLEGLEDRCVPSSIQWVNEGDATHDSDNFNYYYQSNAATARSDVEAAISNWENVIDSFNYSDPAAVFKVNITASDQIGGVNGQGETIGETWITSVDSSGKPTGANIMMAQSPAGAGWIFDTSPYDSGEFTILNSRFSATKYDTRYDFVSSATHELGHALGILQTSGLSINKYLTPAGVDRVDSSSKLLLFSNNGVVATFTTSGGLHTYEGPVDPSFPNDPIAPNDLMNDGRALSPGERNLISDLDVLILKSAYGYTINLASTQQTFLCTYEGSTGVLRINKDPQVPDETVTLDTTSEPFGQPFITVDVDGVLSSWQSQHPTSVDVEPGDAGDDNVYILDTLKSVTTTVSGDASMNVFIGNTKGTPSGVQGIFGDVKIEPDGTTSATIVSVRDSTDKSPHTVSVVYPYDGGSDAVILGLAPAAICWSPAYSGGVSGVKVYGGDGGTTGNTWNIDDTSPLNDGLYLETAGSNTVNVSAASGQLDINNTGGLDQTYVGTSAAAYNTRTGSTANIQKEVNVYGAGSSLLYVDDSGDTSGGGTDVVMNDGSLSMGKAKIGWDATPTATGGVTSLNVVGSAFSHYTVNDTSHFYDSTYLQTTGSPGNGVAYNNTVNVLATHGVLNINNDGLAFDDVYVGTTDAKYANGTGSTANINALVDVFGTASTGLYVDDSGDASARTFNLYKGVLTGLSATGEIDWDSTPALTGGVTALHLAGSGLGSTYNVNDTNDFYDRTYLETGDGFNTVNVLGSTGPLTINNPLGASDTVTVGSLAPALGGTLATINGSLDFEGYGATALTVDDSGDATSHDATLGGNSLTGLGNNGTITVGTAWSVSLLGGPSTNSLTASAPGDFTQTWTVSGFATSSFTVPGNFSGELLAQALGTAAQPVQQIHIGGAMTTDAKIKVNYLSSLSVDGDLAGTVNGYGNSGSQGQPTIGAVTIGGDFCGTISAPVIGSINQQPASSFSGHASETLPRADFQSLVLGTVTSTAVISAGAIVSASVAGDMAGQITVAGPLGTLSVGGNLSGSVSATTIGGISVGNNLSGGVSASQSIGTVTAGGTITGSIFAPVIQEATVNGTPSNDTFVLTPSSVVLNGTTILSGTFGSVVVHGGGGNDLFQVRGGAVPATISAGTGDDTFQFFTGAGITGTLDGGGGTNTLDYTGYTGNILTDLLVATATGVGGGIAHIQRVIGSQGNDLIVGNANPSWLIGGTGRNVLIGGAGLATLDASRSSGDNILIGGTTDWDTNLAALEAVMAEWDRTDLGYHDRRSDLLDGTNDPGKTPLNMVNGQLILLTPAHNPASSNGTVHANAFADTLIGSSGIDPATGKRVHNWFLYAVDDAILNFLNGSDHKSRMT
jgi:hypothetical protein